MKGSVQVRGFGIWLTHVRGELRHDLLSIPQGGIIDLLVDGHPGAWQRAPGPDAMYYFVPLATMRGIWRNLMHHKMGDFVRMERAYPAPRARPKAQDGERPYVPPLTVALQVGEICKLNDLDCMPEDAADNLWGADNVMQAVKSGYLEECVENNLRYVRWKKGEN